MDGGPASPRGQSAELLELRAKVLASLKEQGFKVNPHIRPKKDAKSTLRRVHRLKRLEQLKAHRKFLEENLPNARETRIDGADIRPEEIKLGLREVKPDSKLGNLFLWWNLIWWSLPYEHHIGRYMRFVIWDVAHDAPFGLLGLQSPFLRSGVRDDFLGLDDGSVDYWINQSLNANRVGALPPYIILLGSRMVEMTLTANEVRAAYASKYTSRTLMENRRIPSRLLFTTTTSAFGRGSIYERLRYKNQRLNRFIGYTSGAGTFHLPNELYLGLLNVLKEKGLDVRRGYGTGPSRKLRLIRRGMQIVGLPDFAYHNKQRGYYLFPNVINLKAVIHRNKKPRWRNLPFDSLATYWRERWCIPRARRADDWKAFDSNRFFRSATALILGL